MVVSAALLPFPAPWVQRDVLGRERLTRKVYESGEYECAFCYSPVTGKCINPACMSRPGYPVARAQEIVAESEEIKANEARRTREREWSAEYKRERDIEKARADAALETKCKREGKCFRCAQASQGRTLVRHRGQCPKLR